MESFGTDVTLVWLFIRVGLAVGDQGGNTVEGLVAHLYIEAGVLEKDQWY